MSVVEGAAVEAGGVCEAATGLTAPGLAKLDDAQKDRPGFYRFMACAALAASLAGLAERFYPTENTIGGAAAFGYAALAVIWCGLVFSQAQAKRVRTQADIGFAALVLAVAMAAELPRCGVLLAEGGLAAGLGLSAYSPFLSLLAAAMIFLTCVAAASFNQERPGAYKRFMLLATAALLWPLWMRARLDFFPDGGPAIIAAPLLADLAILAAALRDRIALKAMHPIYARMGGVIIAAHILEVVAYDSAPWRVAARALYSVFPG